MRKAQKKHPQDKELEFSYITDGIYIGTNMCCQLHFNDLLAKEGITADISLEEEEIDTPFGAESYLWLPTKDHTPPTPAQMEYGASAIHTLVRLGKKIYVHCKNGHGRSPTLVAAYLVRYKGMSPKEAIAFIKSKRPSIHPTPSQIRAIDKFSRTGGKKRPY